MSFKERWNNFKYGCKVTWRFTWNRFSFIKGYKFGSLWQKFPPDGYCWDHYLSIHDVYKNKWKTVNNIYKDLIWRNVIEYAILATTLCVFIVTGILYEWWDLLNAPFGYRSVYDLDTGNYYITDIETNTYFNSLECKNYGHIENNKITSIFDYNFVMPWLIIAEKILLLIIFFDGIHFLFKWSRNKEFKEEFNYIYNIDDETIYVFKRYCYIPNPWKSSAIYVLIFTIILFLGLTSIDLCAYFLPCDYTLINPGSKNEYIDINNLYYRVKSVETAEYHGWGTVDGVKNYVEQYVKFEPTPLYAGTFWIIFIVMFIGLQFGLILPSRFICIELGHASYLKLKNNKEFLKSIGGTKAEFNAILEKVEKIIASY